MSDPKELTVLIPVYNEADTLRDVIPETCSFCRDHALELIWVNDGSKDDTASILEELVDYGRVVHHKLNRGYGGALKTGIRNATTSYVVSVDADGQHRLTDVLALLEVCLRNDADMVVGAREGAGDALYRKIGKVALRFVAQRLISFDIRDVNSGMKLYRRDLAQRYLDLLPNGMAYSDVILFTFVYQRNLVLEHPITIRERQGGTSTITTRTAFQTLYEIVSVVMLFNPVKIFIPISGGFFMLGLVWSIRFLLLGRGIPIFSSVMFMAAILTFLCGLIAQQISGLRQNFLPPVEL